MHDRGSGGPTTGTFGRAGQQQRRGRNDGSPNEGIVVVVVVAIVYRLHDQFGCRRILFCWLLEPDCPIRSIFVGLLEGPFGKRKEILVIL